MILTREYLNDRFPDLENLKTLDLWGNQIASIEEGFFSGLKNLKELYLEGNQITSTEEIKKYLPNCEINF